MKNNQLWVKINGSNYYKIFTRLNEIGISIYDNKIYNDFVLILTNMQDYEKITKYLVSYDCTIYEITGLKKAKRFFHKYLIFTIASILSIIMLILVNNMIFRIDIKSNKKAVQELVKTSLLKYDLKPLRFKISHQKIESIVKKILDENKDTLEWMEIEYQGLIMNVYVTEKIIPEESQNRPFCDIIATSDAKISSMNIYRGVPLKEINDYVTKGDVILSGEITYNDEVKNRVCASGEIYGEVWYKVKTTVPFVEEYIEYTGKNRYNFNVKINDNKYSILKSRIQNKKLEETNLYKLNDFEINLVKEREYVKKTRILTEEEAYNKALSLASEKINLKLLANEEILVKKVLKKEVNDSTIYLEVFIATKENIGEVRENKESDLNDSGNNKQNSE